MGVGEWIDPLADIHLRSDRNIYFRREKYVRPKQTSNKENLRVTDSEEIGRSTELISEFCASSFSQSVVLDNILIERHLQGGFSLCCRLRRGGV